MPLQGRLDNRYEVRRSLGRGGMAEVYLARDRVLDRDVALKILNPCYAEDEEFVRRFRREARSAASLSHPNVVSIHDLGEVGGGVGEPPTYYIAMEYIEGDSLRDLLEREVRLSCADAVAIARQVAEGLRAAHVRGLVHRDVKPRNILLSGSAEEPFSGVRGEVKVADFGIARTAARDTATSTGGILGTAHYLSPEQAMGGEATPQSDLYSLGVVLYEMLTGRRPYDAESPVGVAIQHVTGDLRSPKQVLPDLPEGLNSTVVRLLGKDPEERHRDADELLADLAAPSFGREPSVVNAASRAEPRRRALRAGLLAPLCALVMLTAALWGAHQQGFGLSSLAGAWPGGVRAGIEDVLRGMGGDDGGRGARPEEPVSGVPETSAPESETPEPSVRGEEHSGGSARGENSEGEPRSNAPENEGTEHGSGGASVGGGTGGGEAIGDDPGNDAPGGLREETAQEPRDEAGRTVRPGEAGGGAGGTGVESRSSLVYVPDLAGQSVEAARQTLKSTGFRVAGVVEEPGRSPGGTVLYTDPPAGSALEPGAGVTLVASSGAVRPPGEESGGSGGGPDDGGPVPGGEEEAVVTVPDVSGRQSGQAVSILESAGLRAEVRGAFGGGPYGKVVDSDPPAGSRIEEGTLVTLTVMDDSRTSAATAAPEGPAADQYAEGFRASPEEQYSNRPQGASTDQYGGE